jgi:hypothetical protein
LPIAATTPTHEQPFARIFAVASGQPFFATIGYAQPIDLQSETDHVS